MLKAVKWGSIYLATQTGCFSEERKPVLLTCKGRPQFTHFIISAAVDLHSEIGGVSILAEGSDAVRRCGELGRESPVLCTSVSGRVLQGKHSHQQQRSQPPSTRPYDECGRLSGPCVAVVVRVLQAG